MKLTFLGTRGNIPIRSRRHRRHAMLLVSGRGGRLLIDCGEDWLGRIDPIRPAAILVTHGHPDHAAGLRHGAPCPVYATADTWRLMARWPLARRELRSLHAVTVAGFRVEPFPVEHSLNAPAVGFKISARRTCIFYVPDVAALRDPRSTLEGVDLYVGDGAVVQRPLVRQRGPAVIGHASVIAQLEWCRASGVARAVFTHCGSGIVRADTGEIEALVRSLARTRGVSARVAYDGMALVVRRARETRRRSAGEPPADPRSTDGVPPSIRPQPRRSVC